MVALYVRCGSRFETHQTNGLSHFMEHMLFRGSKRHPSSYELNLAIEELGGTLYAETGRHHGLYQVAVNPRAVDGALSILGDLFAGPMFKDIELERQIVLEEILEDLDDHGRNVNVADLAQANAWPGHPLGFPITGPARNVRRFREADVRRHFRRFCGARNLVMCVTGPLDHAEVKDSVARAFATVPAGKRVKARGVRGRLGGPKVRCLRTDAAQSQVQIHFRGVPVDHADFPALSLLCRLIDDGMATPLHYRIADQKGLAYNVSADLVAFADTSLVEFDAACAPGKLTALIEELGSILREFMTVPVGRRELDRALRRYRDDLEACYDDVGALSSWFGGTELYHRATTHAARMQQMARVTPEQVRKVAAIVFAPDRLSAVIAGTWEPSQARKVKRLLASM
jgi:predicted Zn-dependent peptidase